ncbi:MAG: CAP domain-containing protein [Hyphomicrobiaceae bacterium]
MSRVLLATALALAVTGCSQGNAPLSTSLTDTGTTPSLGRDTRAARQGALGGEPAVAGEQRRAPQPGSSRLASLDDRAPKGTYDKAPKGSLADRDFSATRLDPAVARDAINNYRKQKGLKPLQLNANLTAAAKAHATDLAKWDRISHFGSDGSNPWDRVKRAGYNAKLAAENVGTGQVTFDEVMKGWKDSPGHNKNLLLGDAEQMGIALVHDPKTEFKTFWTLVLGSSL